MALTNNRRGIILAGGRGTRLHPLTQVVSKQLLPVYDKPMIYYPLTTLMLSGIRSIMIITTPQDSSLFSKLLGDGSQWGLDISYAIQPDPQGIAQALIIARQFIDKGPSALILGDNIFYGHDLVKLLQKANTQTWGATVFASPVNDPSRYGVVDFDDQGKPINIQEKPTKPRSNYAVTGLYFYDQRACEFASELTPSQRGELEITDLNRRYLKKGLLTVERLGRGHAWFDVGTHDSLLDGASFIATLQQRQGLQVACPEEVAFNQGWICKEQLVKLAAGFEKNIYGQYLLALLDQKQ